jgi:hypothetical protein
MEHPSQVPLEHPKRFRIEMTFSRGADISSLEVYLFILNASKVSISVFLMTYMNIFFAYIMITLFLCMDVEWRQRIFAS